MSSQATALTGRAPNGFGSALPGYLGTVRLRFIRDAPAVATVGLAAVSALHVVWARGSSFPASSPAELTALVAGIDPLQKSRPAADQGVATSRPGHGAPETWAVAILLAVAAVAVALTSRGIGGRRTRRIVAVSAAALATRAAAGIAADLADFGHMTPQFRRWNRRLYSPLCAVLSLGAFASLARNSGNTVRAIRSNVGS